MDRIRRLNIFDKSKLLRMSNVDSYDFKYNIAKEITCGGQIFLPLPMKFLPESFVFERDGEICGLISVSTAHGNPYRINIKRLLFKGEDYLTGKELINHTVGYYGELGAKIFKVIIDNNQKDLESLFVKGCGFRCGSWENLWDITNDINRFKEIIPINFKNASDGQIKRVSELVNSELLAYYKPSLEQYPEEFKSPLLKIFSSEWENSYILIRSKNVVAYLTIKTTDNKNFVITLIKNNGYRLDYDRIISFALKTIGSKRNSSFNAYIRQRKCFKFSDDFEQYLHEHGYECVQTQHVLIKDFYRPVKEEYKSFIFSEGKLISN